MATLALIWSGMAYGNKGATTPTVYADIDYGFSTYKSKLLQSNDTSSSLRYAVGVYAGRDKTISVAISSDSASTAFELNSSQYDTTFFDTYIRYHFWYLYFGAMINSTTMKATNDSGTVFDLTGSGFGGNFGGRFPFGKGSEVIFNVDSVTTSEVQEITNTTVSVNPRLLIDIGASFNVTRRLIDFIVGYRMNTYSVTTDSSYAESLTTTYFGVGFDTVF